MFPFCNVQENVHAQTCDVGHMHSNSRCSMCMTGTCFLALK